MLEKIRKAARGKNEFGFCCSALLCLKREGGKATRELIRKHREEKAFERKTIRSLTLPEEEREKQRRDSEAGPAFSIVVPLYNTPEAFLREMIHSVSGQSWDKWELLLADGSDDGIDRGSIVHEAAKCDKGKTGRKEPSPLCHIRYRKLERNGGISGNSNTALEMAEGEYIILLDHDDLLVPSALWEVGKAIKETGADFLYSDEAVFASPEPRKILEIHRKGEYSQEALLRSNYICHLAAFRRELLQKTGGFRAEYDGSQDHDLFLRLTDEAATVVHIPKVLYFWRSHEGSVAGNIQVKDYAVDAGQRAVRDFLLEKKGIRAEVTSSEECETIYSFKVMTGKE